MSIAYLILAHHQPNHLACLIRALDSQESTFFVHVDLKASEGPFRVKLEGMSNVYFIKPRVCVHWGGFSQVQATLALIEAAWGSETRFRRFCLLSGADFPIKSNVHILEALHSDQEFMRVDHRLDVPGEHSLVKNVAKYWFLDGPQWLHKALSGRIVRQPYRAFPLYHGSSWWALTRDCVEFMRQFIKANPAYVEFMRYSKCSDEIFFHSIVKLSPFSGKITDDFECVLNSATFFQSNKHGTHYINWNAKSGSLPKVLGLEDFDFMIGSGAMFARKFDEKCSKALVEALKSRRELADQQAERSSVVAEQNDGGLRSGANGGLDRN